MKLFVHIYLYTFINVYTLFIKNISLFFIITYFVLMYLIGYIIVNLILIFFKILLYSKLNIRKINSNSNIYYINTVKRNSTCGTTPKNS